MNLIIDVGNTRVKAAVFKGDTLQKSFSFEHSEIKDRIEKIKETFQIKHTIVSKVTSVIDTDLQEMFKNEHFMEVSNTSPVPFKNAYKTPKTLGVDRIALAAAAIHAFPNKNSLIIDAGTCITFDFVSQEKEYLGGGISPGINMRYKSLHAYTNGLPSLNPECPRELIGRNTEASIHSGIINGVLNEIEGVISKYRMKYPDLTVVLTGGDTNFLAKQLKSSIFANQNFLLEGLNSILIFNSSK
ncbi:type III pantothenate kinase [Flavobacteriaceae bacterium S356]|uniref:Type III pantothenate kinase n=1 Tax=Asprobacillus argus TaxID=3076534 RepID=A0ABU3LEZ7_9FLAO|nr:type III pantothenate kinase [Flavobacteriaceae bacterium S356]